MKKIQLLFLFFVTFMFLVNTATAEETNFSAEFALDWLLEQDTNGNYGGIIETALVTILLDEIGATDQAEQAYEYLESAIDSNNCWPSGSCTIKDTAFATYAKYERLYSIKDQKDWFVSSAARRGARGKFWLQMVGTSESGNCQVTYSYKDVSNTKDIAVEKGNFTCGDGLWLDLDYCIARGLLGLNPTINFEIDCADLGSPTLSLIYYLTQTTEDLIILNLVDPSVGDIAFTVNSGCFGTTPSSNNCDYETSLYAYWALDRIGSPSIAPIVYIIENYDEKDVLHNAILYLVKPEQNQFRAEALVGLQRSTGDWDKNVYKTSFAILALTRDPEYSAEVDKAVEWLKSKQKADGSWNSRVSDTAIALYAAFADELSSYAPQPITTPDDGICDLDDECEPEAGETYANCPTDCPTECNLDGICQENIGETKESCEDCQLRVSQCNEDGVCEAEEFFENYVDCPLDCSCGDGVCDYVEDADESCPEDCGSAIPTPTQQEAVCGNQIREGDEECDGADAFLCPGECQDDCTCETDGGFPWWLLIVIIIILVIIYIYFQYIKKGKSLRDIFKKKSNKPSQRPPFKPYSTVIQKQQGSQVRNQPFPVFRRPIKSQKTKDSESKLDKSLDEAKRLFRKK